MARVALVLLALLCLAAPARAQDGIASQDVEPLASVRTANHAMIAAVAGDRLFIGGPATLQVFDITDPGAPAQIGIIPSEGANEAEDVVTNGRILALAGQRGVQIYDVTGATPQKLSTIGGGGQVAACIEDCRYLWVTGPNTIYDLADPAAPEQIGDFDPDSLDGPCFQAREVRPGLVLVACDPMLLFSTLPEHGGSPSKPKQLASGSFPEASFTVGGAVHSAHWPQAGLDRFVLTTLETPFNPECTDQIGAFTTWDATAAAALRPGARFTPIASWRPTNGTFADGRNPYNAIGCSPHFLDEHPAFADRGLDVLRWTGDTFVPPKASAPSAPPAADPPPAPRLRLAGAQAPRSGPPSLLVEVPAAGRLTARVTGRAGRFKGTIRTGRATTTQSGLVRIPLSLPKRARLELRRRGRLTLDTRLDFRPTSGPRQTLRARTTLRRTR